MAWPYTSESSGIKFHLDCWYGVNGSTGNPQKWPFVRIPMDRSRNTSGNRLTAVRRPSLMPSIFDGYWIHNGKDERVNARHSKQRRTNILFFDGSARSFDTFQVPSVRDKTATAIQWRFPEN